jgi:RNA polymerase sigma-70 factor (ECF subfamily)
MVQTLAEPAAPLPCGSVHLDTEAVFLQSADFVWHALHRLGIPPADVEDAMQEVYVVVHRKLGTYDGECRLTTWLFGICLNIAHRFRRRAYFRRERPSEVLPESIDEATPELHATRAQARRLLEKALATLSPEHRATFVLFELEGQSCADIAELMGVPVGTVYSRLHAARRRVAIAGARLTREEP